MTDAKYEMKMGELKDPGGIEITEKQEIILVMPTDKQFIELEKIISVLVQKAVKEEVTKVAKRLDAWIAEQDERNADVQKRSRAGDIAQKKHMRVVETYLKGFNKLLGRKK